MARATGLRRTEGDFFDIRSALLCTLERVILTVALAQSRDAIATGIATSYRDSGHKVSQSSRVLPAIG